MAEFICSNCGKKISAGTGDCPCGPSNGAAVLTSLNLILLSEPRGRTGTSFLRVCLFLSLAPLFVLGPALLSLAVFGELVGFMGLVVLLGLGLSVAVPNMLPKRWLGLAVIIGAVVSGLFLLFTWKILLWLGIWALAA